MAKPGEDWKIGLPKGEDCHKRVIPWGSHLLLYVTHYIRMYFSQYQASSICSWYTSRGLPLDLKDRKRRVGGFSSVPRQGEKEPTGTCEKCDKIVSPTVQEDHNSLTKFGVCITQ